MPVRMSLAQLAKLRAERAPAGSLSRWHETEACKQAYALADARKREAIEKMKLAFKARKELLAREANEWVQVPV